MLDRTKVYVLKDSNQPGTYPAILQPEALACAQGPQDGFLYQVLRRSRVIGKTNCQAIKRVHMLDRESLEFARGQRPLGERLSQLS